MEQKNKLIENANEVQESNWLIQICKTAIVENDTEFIRAFNKRVERFKYLFIEND